MGGCSDAHPTVWTRDHALLHRAAEHPEAPGVQGQRGQRDLAGRSRRARAVGLLRQRHRRRDLDERRPGRRLDPSRLRLAGQVDGDEHVLAGSPAHERHHAIGVEPAHPREDPQDQKTRASRTFVAEPR